MDEINKSMGEAGMSIDFNNLKPADIEELIASLGEMEVNVAAADGNHVRVFCAQGGSRTGACPTGSRGID